MVRCLGLFPKKNRFFLPLPLGTGGPNTTDEFSEKFQRGGRVKKFMLQIFAIIDDTSVMNFRKNEEGGGQRLFGTFPKIHPFWRRSASLRCI